MYRSLTSAIGISRPLFTVERGKAYSQSGIPVTPEGVYLCDGFYIDPEDPWS